MKAPKKGIAKNKRAVCTKNKSPSSVCEEDKTQKPKKAKPKIKSKKVYEEPLALPEMKKKRRRWIVKEEAGRPMIISDEEELQDKIDEYFDTQVGMFPAKDADGNVIIKSVGGIPQIVFDKKAPTITGLALYLGFSTRQSIYDYIKRNDKFSYIIKRAVARIEEYAENIILGGGIVGSNATSGAIFWAKVHGWKCAEDDDKEDYGELLKKLAQIEIERGKDE